MKTLSVLIVDDSLLFIRLFEKVLSQIPNLKVLGYSRNGRDALLEIEKKKPDVVTVDLEMPIMGGIELLENIDYKTNKSKFIIISSHSLIGARQTIEALNIGAFGYIAKPNAKSAEKSIDILLKEFNRVFQEIYAAQVPVSKYSDTLLQNKRIAFRRIEKVKAVVIGISTGGPKALKEVFMNLPPQIGVPIFVGIHMGKELTETLALSLNQSCQINVLEAKDHQEVFADHVYLTPGGKHMRVESRGKKMRIRITDESPYNHCKPSINFLFDSISKHYGDGKVLAITMTGMGNDGIEGLRSLKDGGAFTIAQDMESCAIFGMPRAAIEEGLIDCVVPLKEISTEILKRTLG